jgi:large subunit ribosomal protein L15
MKLHELRPAKGAVKKSKRIGRGQGSGKGGTATRGHKGAKSRSGYSQKRGFEGGQIPLQRRLPKKGFKSFNATTYEPFNFSKINELVEKYTLTEFSFEVLRDLKLVNKSTKIKVLAQGELNASVNFTVHAMSAKAKEVIESKGNTVTLI